MGYKFSPLILLTILLFAACARVPRQYNSKLDPGLLSQTHGETININTATPDELEKLPGIGKVLAERIVTYRSQHGRFRRPEHLMMVRGISDRKFRELRQFVAVD